MAFQQQNTVIDQSVDTVVTVQKQTFDQMNKRAAVVTCCYHETAWPTVQIHTLAPTCLWKNT